MECAINESLRIFYKKAVLPLKKAAPGAYASRTILWEGMANTHGQVLTLNDAYTNYDYIIGYMWNDDSTIAHSGIGSTTEAALRLSTFSGGGAPVQQQMWLHFTTATTVTLEVNSGTTWALARLEGIKFYPNPNDYSTTEKAIGKWIDGKTLYQRTFTGTTPATDGMSYEVDLTALGIDKVVHFYGGCEWLDGFTMPVLFSQTTLSQAMFMTVWTMTNASDNHLYLIANTATYHSRPYWVTLQYTKN